MSDTYCSLIHGGLVLNFKYGEIQTAQCCLQYNPGKITSRSIWNDIKFIPLRKINQQNQWAFNCKNCETLEKNGVESLRTGMNKGLGIKDQYNLSGPARIDLMFDTSCNLACRTCDPRNSTFWQKHLTENNQQYISTIPVSYLQVIEALAELDLSNLRMLVFSGGETLLGQTYWKVAEWLADNVPNAKQNLTLCFQTNATQPINERNYKTIEKVFLVQLQCSLDGIDKRFEYLRWPAKWDQVSHNLAQIKNTAPSNTMFLVEETVSIFNFYYMNELEIWAKTNFAVNREQDPINHNRHLASRTFSIQQLTQEYVDAMQDSPYKNFISVAWRENSTDIIKMIAEIKKFDQFRGQSFEKTFPEVAEFYARYL